MSERTVFDCDVCEREITNGDHAFTATLYRMIQLRLERLEDHLLSGSEYADHICSRECLIKYLGTWMDKENTNALSV